MRWFSCFPPALKAQSSLCKEHERLIGIFVQRTSATKRLTCEKRFDEWQQLLPITMGVWRNWPAFGGSAAIIGVPILLRLP